VRYTGRTKPYTVRGIKRLGCARCGRPAHATWSACANGNRQVPLCAECDFALNTFALTFMRLPDADALLAAYRRTLEAQIGRPLDDA
jgi:NAD-dependent SIR2 family protein deacetylase